MDKTSKILWFSNTPAAADEFVCSNSTGGWLKSLDKAIQNSVELHVAYSSDKLKDVFKVGNTTYHPIYNNKKKSLLGKIVDYYRVYPKDDNLSKYLNIVESVKPDIIHVHGTEKSFANIAGHTSIPIVVSVQAIMTVVCQKYYEGIGEKAARTRNYDSLKRYILDNYVLTYKKFVVQAEIERKNMAKVQYIIGRTEWDRRCMSVIAPQAKYFHNNEIMRDGFYSHNWHSPALNEKIIIHTTTGLLLFKGFETICESLNILNNNGYNVEWRIAGISETDLVNRIVRKSLGNKYPIKGLLLLGSVSESDLIDLLLEAHIFVSPSHQDNSPNSLCEALLMGLPCIATLAGGTGALLKDGVDGIIIQDGDPYSMAGSVVEYISNYDLAIQYGKNARERALKRHDKETIVSDLLTIYSKCINNN